MGISMDEQKEPTYEQLVLDLWGDEEDETKEEPEE